MLRACPEFIEGVNGNHMDVVENSPFMLSLSKHEGLAFQQKIKGGFVCARDLLSASP
jgi:hypothetical protein